MAGFNLKKFISSTDGKIVIAVLVAAVAYGISMMLSKNKKQEEQQRRYYGSREEVSGVMVEGGLRTVPVAPRAASEPALIMGGANVPETKTFRSVRLGCEVPQNFFNNAIIAATEGANVQQHQVIDRAFGKYNSSSDFVGFGNHANGLNVVPPMAQWLMGMPLQDPWPDVCYELWNTHPELRDAINKKDYDRFNMLLRSISNKFMNSRSSGLGNNGARTNFLRSI